MSEEHDTKKVKTLSNEHLSAVADPHSTSTASLSDDEDLLFDTESSVYGDQSEEPIAVTKVQSRGSVSVDLLLFSHALAARPGHAGVPPQ